MLAADILSLDDVQINPVEVPEWKTTLHVRSLSGHERAKLVGRVKACEKDGSDPSVYVVVACCCGEATCSSFGGKAKPEDFMIRDQQSQELPPEIVAEVAAARMRGRKRRHG